MTGTRGDATGHDAEGVRVDLDGLPTTWPVRQGRWAQRLWVVFAAYWLFNFVFRLVRDGGTDVVSVVLGAVMVVLSLGNLAVIRTQRVQLEPEGYRRGDVVFKGRLRPWSSADHVRPGNARWGTQAEIRGGTAAAAPVPLHGMSEEQAVELQRRLTVARARSADAGDARVSEL